MHRSRWEQAIALLEALGPRRRIGAWERAFETLEQRTAPAFGLPTPISVVPSGTSTASSSSSAGARSLSNDGRYQVFGSTANNLVTGLTDTNGGSDVFVRDLWTGQTIAASVNPAGTATGSSTSSNGIISGNGRYVLFSSLATNLVATSVTGSQIYRRDLLTNTTELVTINAAGTAGVTSLSVSRFTVSDDGRYVCFEGNALNAVTLPDTNGGGDVYLRDMQMAQCILVSRNSAGTAAADNTSFRSTISANGNAIVFRSDARDLLPAGPVYVNSSGNIYVYSVATATLSLASQLSQVAGTGAGSSYFGANSVSADGRYMVYNSTANNMAANTSDFNSDDVFLYDRITNTNTLVSRNSTGTGTGTSSSSQPAISADGNFVVFTSSSTNFTALGSGGFAQVYRWNRVTLTLELVSVNSSGAAAGNQNSQRPQISADGRYVAFQSNASNLTGIVDGNGATDIYVRDMQTATTQLVSVNSAGTGPGNSSSFEPKLSAAGTRIAFTSNASNLGTNLTDSNNSADVFVRDTVANTTVAVNTIVGDTGNQSTSLYANESTRQFSADGRYFVFKSSATNLVPGVIDSNGFEDVFLKDFVTGTVIYLTVNGNNQATGDAYATPAITPDGRYVVFGSESAMGPTPHEASYQVYRKDLLTNDVSMVSVASSGATSGNGFASAMLSISDDGRYVCFGSNATNLVSGLADANGSTDYFVRDMQLGTTVCVSVTTAGTTTGNAGSGSGLISGNGGRVVLWSFSSDLSAASDANGVFDLYVRNLSTNQTDLVSVSTAGAAGNNFTFDGGLSISYDGTKIAFRSRSSNLVAGDSNGDDDVFVRNVTAGTTTLVSVNSGGSAPGNGGSYLGSMNAAGTHVAFSSVASNLIVGDGNGNLDVFLRNLTAGTTTLVSRNSAGSGPGNGGSGGGLVSADGSKVLFRSGANNLVALSDANLGDDVFLRNVTASTTTAVSTDSTGTATANSDYNGQAVMSSDAGRIAFMTSATDVLPAIDDFNNGSDIYGFTVATGVKTLVTSTIEGAFTASSGSESPAFSADGAVVAYLTSSNQGLPGFLPSFPARQLLAFNLGTASRVLISASSTGGGVAANQQINGPALSADGNIIAFYTTASNLSPLDGNGQADVYVRNVSAATTSLVSVNSNGTGPGNQDSSWSLDPVVSPNGQRIAFASAATDLTSLADSNGQPDAFVRNLTSGTTSLVTVNSAGTAAGNGIFFGGGAFNADGSYFAFDTTGTNLVTGVIDLNGSAQDAFFRNLLTSSTTLISFHAAGIFGGFTDSSAFPAISADGSRVAWVGVNNASFVDFAVSGSAMYARDLVSQTSYLVSINSAGQGAATFGDPIISRNGQFVAFTSSDGNIVGNDSNGSSDVFVRDLNGAVTTLASINSAGSAAGTPGGSFAASISADGTWIAFESNSSNLAGTTDANGTRDIYVRDRIGGITYLLSRNSAGAGNGFSSTAIISADGSTVVWSSNATNLVPGLTDANGTSTDLFAGFRDAVAVVDVIDVAPDPRTSSVSTVDVVLSRVVNLSSFDHNDVTLTLNGGPNLITASQTVIYVGGTTYRINNLAGITNASGNYVLTVLGAGMLDSGFNSCIGAAADAWTTTIDTTPPTAVSLGPVAPNPRNFPVDNVIVVLSEPINLATFDHQDLTMTLDGGSNLITNVVTVTYISGNAYLINNLTSLTGIGGLYQLTVHMASVQDLAGNNGLGSISTTWTLDIAPPAVNSFAPISSPRPDPVVSVDVELSEQVDLSTFDYNDLTLTLNGGPNLIDNTVTVEYVPSFGGATYRIGNLSGLTAAGGNYQLTVDLTNVLDYAANAGTGSSSANWTADTVAPQIEGVYFDGTSWSAAFRAAAGNATYGYPAQTAAAQLTSMPWSTINVVSIQFSENVDIANGDLDVRGSNVADYATTMTYDNVNFVARFTFAGPIDTDRILIDLDGDGVDAVRDGAGNKLAGSWTQASSSFPTTGPAGIDFLYRFVIAVGDADRNGFVRNQDLNAVRNQLFVDVGAGGYSIYADIDGNGLTRNADLNATRNHLFVDPPTGPGPFRAGRAPQRGIAGRARVEFARFIAQTNGSDETRTIAPRRPTGGQLAASALDQFFESA